jgi:hypothetical protein
MKQKRPRHESHDSDAASEPKAETPMEKFKGLTRQLLGVSRDQLRVEQARYDKNKKSKRT